MEVTQMQYLQKKSNHSQYFLCEILQKMLDPEVRLSWSYRGWGLSLAKSWHIPPPQPKAGQVSILGNPDLAIMHLPWERLKLGQDVSLQMGVRIWAQIELQDGCTGPWGRVKARLKCRPAGSGVPWLGRAELWRAGDQPCYSLIGVWVDGPGGLKWDTGTWTG